MDLLIEFRRDDLPGPRAGRGRVWSRLRSHAAASRGPCAAASPLPPQAMDRSETECSLRGRVARCRRSPSGSRGASLADIRCASCLMHLSQSSFQVAILVVLESRTSFALIRGGCCATVASSSQPPCYARKELLRRSISSATVFYMIMLILNNHNKQEDLVELELFYLNTYLCIKFK